MAQTSRKNRGRDDGIVWRSVRVQRQPLFRRCCTTTACEMVVTFGDTSPLTFATCCTVQEKSVTCKRSTFLRFQRSNLHRCISSLVRLCLFLLAGNPGRYSLDSLPRRERESRFPRLCPFKLFPSSPFNVPSLVRKFFRNV